MEKEPRRFTELKAYGLQEPTGRWDELQPEIQVAVIHLINTIASFGSWQSPDRSSVRSNFKVFYSKYFLEDGAGWTTIAASITALGCALRDAHRDHLVGLAIEEDYGSESRMRARFNAP